MIETLQQGPVGGTTPTNRDGTNNVDLAKSYARYDEAGRQYETQQDVFIAAGVTLPSGRDITHTGGGLAANSIANNHTGQVTLTAAGSSYVLTRSVYDRAGRLVSQVADNAAETDYEYDGAGRAVKVTDDDENTVETTYDPNGNAVAVKRTEKCTIDSPSAADEIFESAGFYDALNRPVLTAQQGPDGILNLDLSDEDNQTLLTLIGYDSRGNRTFFMDPKNNTAVSIYDGAGRVIETHQHMRAGGDGSAGPESGTFEAGGGSAVRTQMIYDSNGRLTEIIDDAGAATRYEYDTLDRQTTMTFHDGSTRIAAFGDAGDLETYTDENGSAFVYAYDGLGRRTSVTITRVDWPGLFWKTFNVAHRV